MKRNKGNAFFGASVFAHGAKKKRLSAICLMALVTMQCPCLAETSAMPILENAFQSIKKKRITESSKEPFTHYSKQTQASFDGNIRQIHDILSGRRAKISEKHASTNERITILGGLYQNHILGRKMGPLLSHDDPLVAGHLKALWLMDQAMDMVRGDFNLALNLEKLLGRFTAMKDLTQELKPYLTLKAFEMLFPKGFAKHLLSYAYKIADCPQEVVMKVLFQTEWRISHDKGFNMTPKRGVTRGTRLKKGHLGIIHLEEFDSDGTSKEPPIFAELRELHQKVSDLTFTIDDMEKQEKQLLHRLETHKKTYETLQEEKTQLLKISQEHSALQSGLIEKDQATFKQLEEKIKKSDEEKNTLTQELDALKENIKTLKKEKESTSDTIGATQKRTIQELEEKIKESDRKTQEIQASLTSTTQEKGALEQTLREQEVSIQEFNATLERLRKESDAKDQTLLEKEGVIKELRATLEELKKEAEDKNTILQEKEDVIKELRATLEQLKNVEEKVGPVPMPEEQDLDHDSPREKQLAPESKIRYFFLYSFAQKILNRPFFGLFSFASASKTGS